jgi:hypothetical protein
VSNDLDDNSMQRCGIVVIGRNEGARLGRSLPVAVGSGYPVVYVDSRSSDDSVAVALECGAAVVELDATVRLSAARVPAPHGPPRRHTATTLIVQRTTKG